MKMMKHKKLTSLQTNCEWAITLDWFIFFIIFFHFSLIRTKMVGHFCFLLKLPENENRNKLLLLVLNRKETEITLTQRKIVSKEK